MAFTVEDGSVIADANAYITVQYLEGHFEDRGVDLAATATADKQAAIVKATDYVDKRFSPIFKGVKRTRDQSLQWPRMGVVDGSGYWVDSSTIPTYLKRAIAEYAWLALYLGDLLPTPAPGFNEIDVETGEVTTRTSGPMMREMEKVGPIAEEKWYADINKQGGQRAPVIDSPMVSGVNLPEYPRADEWLKPIIHIGTPRLARA